MENSEVQQHYIKINRIADEVKRPLWSVLIPTYNCAEFLKETLKSVLAQDPGEALMEIIVVDDHSTKDDPEAAVKEFGQRPRAVYIGNQKMLVRVTNYETFGIDLASSGRYIHLLHGDDTCRSMVFTKTIGSSYLMLASNSLRSILPLLL